MDISDRRRFRFKCVQCTGKVADEPAMLRAQCSDASQMAYCQNQTCYDVLDAQCGNEVSCSSCAECVEKAVVPPGLQVHTRFTPTTI